MGGKFKFSAQGSDLAPFIGIWTKIKMPFEIKPALQISVSSLLPRIGNIEVIHTDRDAIQNSGELLVI